MAKKLSVFKGHEMKIFNGVYYSKGGFAKSKSEAEKVASNLRKMGANARIQKLKNGYQVWGRKA